MSFHGSSDASNIQELVQEWILLVFGIPLESCFIMNEPVFIGSPFKLAYLCNVSPTTTPVLSFVSTVGVQEEHISGSDKVSADSQKTCAVINFVGL